MTAIVPCACTASHHEPRLIVVTGGPGAGKTALLEVAGRTFCHHLAVLPEAAGILYSGGFPRRQSVPARAASQRAIYRVQSELERMVVEEREAVVAVCDRGTVDGVAYWPGDPESFWHELRTTRELEMARYHAVIHMRTPPESAGYNHRNPLRVESAAEAARIDARLAEAWKGHPRRWFVDNSADFVGKLGAALALVAQEIPACCRLRADDLAQPLARAG